MFAPVQESSGRAGFDVILSARIDTEARRCVARDAGFVGCNLVIEVGEHDGYLIVAEEHRLAVNLRRGAIVASDVDWDELRVALDEKSVPRRAERAEPSVAVGQNA